MTKGEHRLSLAGRILALEPGANVMAAIKALTDEQRANLKTSVDWLEDYENRLQEIEKETI